eukprot:3212373-Prymnesium_polylepis.1
MASRTCCSRPQPKLAGLRPSSDAAAVALLGAASEAPPLGAADLVSWVAFLEELLVSWVAAAAARLTVAGGAQASGARAAAKCWPSRTGDDGAREGGGARRSGC